MKTTVIETDNASRVTVACFADTIIIVTAIKSFKILNFSMIRSFMKNLTIFNGRNLSC